MHQRKTVTIIIINDNAGLILSLFARRTNESYDEGILEIEIYENRELDDDCDGGGAYRAANYFSMVGVGGGSPGAGVGTSATVSHSGQLPRHQVVTLARRLAE